VKEKFCEETPSEAEEVVDPRYTSRYTITLPMMYFQSLAVTSVLFHVVESTCNPLTVTANARCLSRYTNHRKAEWQD